MRTLPPILIVTMLVATPLPAAADDVPPTMEEKLQDTFRDLMSRMAPHLEELQREMEPALQEMQRLMAPFAAIDDPRHYTAPEVLPNGDIIIRRREDAPDYQAPSPSPDAAEPEKPSDEDTIKL